jgi:hypothetical protein
MTPSVIQLKANHNEILKDTSHNDILSDTSQHHIIMTPLAIQVQLQHIENSSDTGYCYLLYTKFYPVCFFHG